MKNLLVLFLCMSVLMVMGCPQPEPPPPGPLYKVGDSVLYNKSIIVKEIGEVIEVSAFDKVTGYRYAVKFRDEMLKASVVKWIPQADLDKMIPDPR